MSRHKLYGDYRFAMHLDWVEFRISLIGMTQAPALQRAMPHPWGPSAFARAANGSRSLTDTAFTFRVQDPHCAGQVRRDLEGLHQKFPFATTPKVTGLEVSFDAYCDGEDSDLLSIAEHMYRGIVDPPSGNRRITGPKGTRGLASGALESRHANMTKLAAGQSLVIGNKLDDHTQRAYIKESPTGKHARFENTLIGTAAPFSTLDEWQCFDFASLARYFRWRRFPPADGLLGLLREHPPALASPASFKARANHQRIHKRGTVADRELSDAAREALRRLTTLQRRPVRGAPGIWTEQSS